MEEYNHHKLQVKWQKRWQKSGLYSPDLDRAKKPFYNLMMFPYPSAEGLHVGNMYAFTGSDIYGRFKRMKGYTVFEPIGLDGFGIHSENYAIKVNRHPKEQAKISQKNFYRQLKSIGNAYDWTRTLETYDPDYYKWTQWIFIKLFRAGLAYRKKSSVNFCPSCKTVLADEQVIEGKCERCGTVVEKKEIEQWFFRITKYADRLLEGLTRIDWSQKVKIAQRNWIGKKQGINIKYQILSIKYQVEVFTTRPDTLFGATFLALAPEHSLVASLRNPKSEIRNPKREEIREYVEKSIKKTEQERLAEGREKTGVFSGLYAFNRVNQEKIPVWIADYVLAGYGTSAIMAVPGHDRRDFEFAKKFKLPIKRVVVGSDGDRSSITRIEQVQEEEGTIVNSQFLDGMNTSKATEKIMDYLEGKGWGQRKTTYHLRDWLISRQRYWGPPIPIIYCVRCRIEQLTINNQQLTEGVDFAVIDGIEHAIIPVPENDLPVLLPDVHNWRPTGTSKSPLASIESFVNTKCPNCKGDAKRETDISDTFLDSAWYFLRYLATDSNDLPFPISNTGPVTTFPPASAHSKLKSNGNQKNNVELRAIGIPSPRATRTGKIKNSPLTTHHSSLAGRARWLPVDMYIGGAEHAVLHLLYTRFLTMIFKDLGLIDFEEPFTKFRAHGLLISKGAKMSKSKGNIVNPDDYIKKYGSDTLRCYLMFCGRFKQGGDFRDEGIEGMARFLRRVWRLYQENSKLDNKAAHIMHQTIKRVTEDIESLDYNTAISALMIWLNALEKRVAGSAKPGARGPVTSFPPASARLSKKSSRSGNEPELRAVGSPSTGATPRAVITKEEVKNFLLLLAPFAPHITEELWQLVHSKKNNTVNREPKTKLTKNWSIHLQPWPKHDEELAKANQIELVVEVNGKVRDRLDADRDLIQKDAEKLALSSHKVKKYINGRDFKVIYVKDKLINFFLK